MEERRRIRVNNRDPLIFGLKSVGYACPPYLGLPRGSIWDRPKKKGDPPGFSERTLIQSILRYKKKRHGNQNGESSATKQWKIIFKSPLLIRFAPFMPPVSQAIALPCRPGSSFSENSLARIHAIRQENEAIQMSSASLLSLPPESAATGFPYGMEGFDIFSYAGAGTT